MFNFHCYNHYWGDRYYNQEDSNSIFELILQDDADALAEILNTYNDPNLHVKKPSNFKYPNILSSCPRPLHIAAFFGSENCFDLLMNMSADDTKTDAISKTVQCFAAAGGKLEILRKYNDFAQEDEDQNRSYDYNYSTKPMHYAISYGNADCVKYIWSKGFVFTPKCVHLACRSGSFEIVQFIHEQFDDFKKHMDIFIKDKTALMNAAESGNADIVNFLLKLGPKINQISEHGETAIVYAARVGSLSCVQALVEAGALFNVKARKYNAFVEAATQGHLDIMKYLIEQGVDINITTSDRECAFSCAIKNNMMQVVKYLVLKKATVAFDINDLRSTTPDIIKFLIGLNVLDLKNDVIELIRLSFQVCNFKLLEYLITLLDKNVKYINTSDLPTFSLNNIPKKMIPTFAKNKYFMKFFDTKDSPIIKNVDNFERLECWIENGAKISKEIIENFDLISTIVRRSLPHCINNAKVLNKFMEYKPDLSKSDSLHNVVDILIQNLTYYAIKRDQNPEEFEKKKIILDSTKKLFDEVLATGLKFDIVLHCIESLVLLPKILPITKDPQEMYNNMITMELTKEVIPELEKAFKEGIFDPSGVDTKGCNVFHKANFYYPDARELISYFLQWSVDINQKNADGKTPFEAMIYRHNYLACLYIEFGADISMKKENSNTLLHTLFDNPELNKHVRNTNCDGLLYVLKLLIDYGLDLNAKNSLKQTPLYRAEYDLDCMIYMIERGADVNKYPGGAAILLGKIKQMELSHSYSNKSISQTRNDLISLIEQKMS